MYGIDFSTGISTSPLRAVAILTRDHFHKVSRAVGPQKTGVQHTEETNLSTEVSGIASDFEESFRAGTKQEIVDHLFVLQHHWGQVAGECEDNV